MREDEKPAGGGKLASPEPALHISQLVKKYGHVEAARSISFDAHFGSITAVLGPNGAGKSTTLACATGLSVPSSGTVRLLGADPLAMSADQRARVGVMLQDGGLTSGAQARHILEYGARMYARARNIDELAGILGIDSFARTIVRRLSGGQRQRLSLALALVGRPDVIFLDEPTAGMDAAIRHRTRELIREEAQRGAAVILTTHAIDDVEALADHVVVIAQGRVIADGSPTSVISNMGGNLSSISLTAHAPSHFALEEFASEVRASASRHGVQLSERDYAAKLEDILITLGNGEGVES